MTTLSQFRPAEVLANEALTVTSPIAAGTAGEIPYVIGTNSIGLISVGSNGEVLTLVSGSPAWQPAPVSSLTTGYVGYGVAGVLGGTSDLQFENSDGSSTLTIGDGTTNTNQGILQGPNGIGIIIKGGHSDGNTTNAALSLTSSSDTSGNSGAGNATLAGGYAQGAAQGGNVTIDAGGGGQTGSIIFTLGGTTYANITSAGLFVSGGTNNVNGGTLFFEGADPISGDPSFTISATGITLNSSGDPLVVRSSGISMASFGSSSPDGVISLGSGATTINSTTSYLELIGATQLILATGSPGIATGFQINSSGALGIGTSSPAFGNVGNLIISGGSGAQPTWSSNLVYNDSNAQISLGSSTSGSIVIGSGPLFAINVSSTISQILDASGLLQLGSSGLINLTTPIGLQINGQAGTAGQILVTAGSGSPPSWSSTVPQLTITNSPVASTDATNKNYVDNAINGLSWKNEVQYATTTNITLSGEQTIDGYGTNLSRVLVKNQTDQTQNGIYVSSPGAWSRSSDTSTGAELVGAAVFVTLGSQAGTAWTQNTAGSIVIGTSNINWVQFGAPGGYSAGYGLSLAGNTFNNAGVLTVGGTANQIIVTGGTGGTGNLTLSLAPSAYISTALQIGGGAPGPSSPNGATFQTGTGSSGFAIYSTILSSQDSTNYSLGFNGSTTSVNGTSNVYLGIGGTPVATIASGSMSVAGDVTATRIAIGTSTAGIISGDLIVSRNSVSGAVYFGTTSNFIFFDTNTFHFSGGSITCTGGFVGNASSATTATTATTATNIAGGTTGELPFQSAAGTTAFSSKLTWTDSSSTLTLNSGSSSKISLGTADSIVDDGTGNMAITATQNLYMYGPNVYITPGSSGLHYIFSSGGDLNIAGSSGTAGQVLTSQGTGAHPTWTTPSVPNPVAVTSAYTASVNDLVIADTTTSAFTVTLPASPVFGQRVHFADGGGTWATNNLTISGNGANISGSSTALVINQNNDAFSLVYYNSTRGWIIAP